MSLSKAFSLDSWGCGDDARVCVRVCVQGVVRPVRTKVCPGVDKEREPLRGSSRRVHLSVHCSSTLPVIGTPIFLDIERGSDWCPSQLRWS